MVRSSGFSPRLPEKWNTGFLTWVPWTETIGQRAKARTTSGRLYPKKARTTGRDAGLGRSTSWKLVLPYLLFSANWASKTILLGGKSSFFT